MANDPTLLGQFETEQEELATLSAGLTDDQWALPSLCRQWTVRQTVVHVAWHIHRGPREVVGAGLSTLVHGSARATARQVARDETRSTESLVEWLATPGQCDRVNLGELVIHHQDIRRPLGMVRQIPPERLTPIFDFCLTRVGSATLVPGARKRAMGIGFVATDMDWSAGEGPEVRGPGEALLMAINGRASALDDLQGPGVPILASRQPPGTQ